MYNNNERRGPYEREEMSSEMVGLNESALVGQRSSSSSVSNGQKEVTQRVCCVVLE